MSPIPANMWLTTALSVILFVARSSAANFTQCRADVTALLPGNRTDFNASILPLSLGFDPIYHGVIRGLASGSPRPLTLTKAGCDELCGSDPELNDVLTAFQILTTWVLPAVSLLCQLPYESLSTQKWRNFLAFLNWVGAPAASLATTIYNIFMIKECQEESMKPTDEDRKQGARDALFVLSCINQYEYPRDQALPLVSDRRNKSLMRGTLWPFIKTGSADGDLSKVKFKQLKSITGNLAFQLRLQRRKAVWPLAVNTIWFLVAFVISIVTAFADLGDNTTAHSLALGLLLSWLPILVVMAVVDRNPAGSERCRNLIERWLCNVEQIVDATPEAPAKLWNRDSEGVFSIGEFVGQGRTLRYCGVTRIVLSQIHDARTPHLDLSKVSVVLNFDKALIRRDWLWWVTWGMSQLVVSVCFGMAFMVSFKTPTIGLGCRSLLYLVWYLTSSVSWVVLGFRQEPEPCLRWASQIPNFLATGLLFVIMGFQVTNGLNTCACKSSIYGLSNYGGYMDFENGVFYRQEFKVGRVWGAGAGFGLAVCVLSIMWAVRRWSKSSSLWKVNESTLPETTEGLPLDWLI